MTECKSIERLLALSAFESLSEEDRRTADDHLRSCEACRAKAAAYRVIASSSADRIQRDADFWNKQRAAVLARIGGSRRLFPLRWATAVAAAIALAVGLRYPRRHRAAIPPTIPDVQMLQDLDMIENLDFLESLQQKDLS
jgi:hypothetical protein